MKKSILALTASAFIITSILTSCSTPAEKLEDAQSKVKDANEELNKANEEYLAEIETFRKEAAEKIAANEKSIAEFKARQEYKKNIAKDDYKKKIAELEQKNSDMKKKMDDYKAEGKEKWELFKAEFSHGMDELGNAFSSLAE